MPTHILLMGVLSAAATPVAPKAEPFPVTDVRLLDGPFRHAMDLDAAYLLRLEPDRLLCRFRENAGLAARGAVYGGWETAGVAGHTLGHYLSACSLIYGSTGDERFRDRVTYIVGELAECQKAIGSGYVAAIPDGTRIFAEIARGEIRSAGFDLNGCWVPFYTLHKLLAGLRDAYHLCGNRQAFEISLGLAGWIEKTLSGLNEGQMQRILACEHGGMNEVLADLYGDTGDERWLALSRRFHHKAVLDPLADGEDRLAGLHGNTQIPKLIGLARRYELTGDERDRRAAEFFWQRVVYHHSYAIGGHSDGEHFGPPDKLSDRLGPNTAETCNTYNMLKLTRHILAWTADARVADFYERAVLNHILASQNPADGMMCYYLPLKPGAYKAYSTPFDSFWCCVGTGMENHARYGETIYSRDAEGLFVNLFIASELRCRERRVTLRQTTDFPDGEHASLLVTCADPTEFSLRIRRPFWAGNGFRASVNGEELAIEAEPGSYLSIRRVWRSGDRVEVRLPMELRLEPMPDNPARVAVCYGPMVLAGELGPEDDPRADAPDYVPVLVTGGRPPSEWLEPVGGQSCTFRTKGVGRPRDVTLHPIHKTHGVRYTVYFDLFTEADWTARKAAALAERERQRKLEAATIDFVQPGEMQPERDHNMKGENTRAGEHLGRKWREAADGWFSFDMKVSPDKPTSLVCTFWGSDVGARTFDILADERLIATKTLANDKPGAFFDVTYPLPDDLTHGKDRVTVRFQARPGNMAGGLFGLRTILGTAD